MKSVKILAPLLLAAGSGLLCSCTANPFGGNKISEEKRKISGSVRLADQSNAKGVLVWMAGFNISTFTDENGGFEINLPPKESQGSAGAISGVFNLYFFVANYLLDSAQVVVQNGAFLYSRGDVNEDGKLNAPRTLRRFLRLSTVLLPPSVSISFTSRIGVNAILEATIDSATVIFPRSVGDLLGAAFFKRTGSDEVFIFEAVPGANTRDVALIARTPNSRLLAFTLSLLPLPAGRYEVIPYILLRHQPLPPGLLASLGANVEALHSDYLKLPFRREGGQFEVQP